MKNKIILLSVTTLIVVAGLIIAIVVLSQKSRIAVDLPEVTESEDGYRTDLTDKEESMLRQFSEDMYNQKNLTVTSYYVQDNLIVVYFDDDQYYGEIEHDTATDEWTARLKQ